MTNAVKLLDRVLFGALLVFIIFIPYSAAMTQVGLCFMIAAWLSKRFLLWQENPAQGLRKSFLFPCYGIQLPLLIIAILILATIPFSFAPALSLKKFFSRFVQQIFLMLCVAETLNTPKRLFQALAVLLSTMVVVNVDIVVQYFRGHSFIFSTGLLYQRVSGPMRHPNDLGTLLVSVIPIILSLLLTHRSWMPQVFKSKFIGPVLVLTGLVFVCSVLALGLTVSRGAWVAFGITIIGYGLYIKNYRLTAAIVLVLVVFFWVFGIRCLNRPDIAGTSDQPDASMVDAVSTNSFTANEKTLFNLSRRDEYSRTALEVVEVRPFFGCGYNAYIQALQKLKLFPQEYPHNSFLHIAAELGLVGLALYLWFFGTLFRKARQILKSVAGTELHVIATGICFGLMAWLVHSLLDTPWESLLLNYVWWTLIGMLLSIGILSKASKKGAV